jgi:hypothetical protein
MSRMRMELLGNGLSVFACKDLESYCTCNGAKCRPHALIKQGEFPIGKAGIYSLKL